MARIEAVRISVAEDSDLMGCEAITLGLVVPDVPKHYDAFVFLSTPSCSNLGLLAV